MVKFVIENNQIIELPAVLLNMMEVSKLEVGMNFILNK